MKMLRELLATVVSWMPSVYTVVATDQDGRHRARTFLFIGRAWDEYERQRKIYRGRDVSLHSGRLMAT